MDKLHDTATDELLSKEDLNKVEEHQAIDDGEAFAGDVEVLSEEESMNVEQLQDELAKQKAKAEEYYNRLLRLQADFDNYRKRTAKEKEEFINYAAASLCEELLPVLDNFQLALAAKEQNPSKVVEGVTMIIRQLQDILHKEGLTPVTSVGEQFDPTRHEAIMQDITDQYPENTVTEELRKGYYLKDKLLRPALVKVAKSGN
jgi:molecular chaperone GrpE